MTLLQTIVLAVVQGLTEFLPISSTAHLVLLPWLFAWQDPGLAYDVALHAGTLVALLAYFARTWMAMLLSLVSGQAANLEVLGGVEHPRRLLGFVALATIPGTLAGYWLETYAETVFRAPRLVAAALLLVAFLMWLADQMPALVKNLNKIELGDAVTVGVAQAVAIVPGVSRAGITIATGMFRGLERETAARFSFLLATPIIAGAGMQKGFPAGVSRGLRHVDTGEHGYHPLPAAVPTAPHIENICCLPGGFGDNNYGSRAPSLVNHVGLSR